MQSSASDISISVLGSLPEIAAFLVATIILYKWLVSAKKYPPGPIGLPLVGYLPFFEEEPHKQFLNLSRKYKSNVISVRLGRALVVVLNEYNTAKDVMCDPRALNRHPDMFAHVKERGFFSNNGLEWDEQRKFCMQACKSIGLGSDHWENLIMEETNGLIADLRSHKGSPIAITEKICSASSNNVISLLIGRRLNPDTEKDKLELLIKFMDQSMSVGLALPVTLIPKLREMLVYLKIGFFYLQHKTVTMFSKFLNEEIERHRTKSVDNHNADFIDLYLRKMEEMSVKQCKHYFTHGNMEGHLNVLFLGGSDTIASSLDWLMRLMAVHPDIQKKCQQEIDEEFGRDGRIFYRDWMKLPYTMAVLMEGQRYSSAVPLSPNRQAIDDIKVNGYTIPKGSHIIANLWAMHYDANYWEQPHEFKPERFLASGGKTVLKNLPSFLPFSIGKRNCPGEKIAYTEMLLVFTSLVRAFRILPPVGEEVHFDFNDGLVPHLKPQPLRFLERQEETGTQLMNGSDTNITP